MRMSNGLSSAMANALEGYLTDAWTTETQGMHLAGMGAVAELETKLREHYGMRHALCVSSGTSGLFAVALALGLRQAEFVTTPYTYGASVAGWLLLGNRPRFADIDPETLTLDSESAQQMLTARTKALLAVDIFGIPSDMFALRELADEYGLWYIADAAQSLGACRGRRPASALADALVVSFTAGKTLFAGEGGAILTQHTELYHKLLWYTQHPVRQRRELGLHLDNEFALNMRIHPLAALWANATFDASLHRLKGYREECFKLIEVLNATGLTEPIQFQQKSIQPSFFRLTATCQGKTQRSQLLHELRSSGHPVRLEKPPVRLLYRQPSFLAQYGRCLRSVPCCPQAEHQAHHRVCVR